MSVDKSLGILDFSLANERAAKAALGVDKTEGAAALITYHKTTGKENDPEPVLLPDSEPVTDLDLDTEHLGRGNILTTGASAQPATPTAAAVVAPTPATVSPKSGQDVGDGGCQSQPLSNTELKFQSYVNGNGNGVYKIIKTLGKGNFAKVKLALHVPTGREVAIKVIDKTQLNTSARQKLYREVRIMKLLNHPNIVRLFQVIESERTLYLVMEYASRGELFDHLVKNGRMRERDARVIFRQLVSAIQYCHSKFVVHRDLKAENLLLDQHMNIKIADFGFGNTFDPNAQLETFCGSPPYAAPELFMGRKYAGPEVDAWSLGVVLYTLVSGSLPFDGGTLKELRERVLRGKYRVPYYISMDCENLMRKFLVLNPAKRTSLTAVMSDKWINLGHDENDRLRAYRERPMELQDPARMDLLVSMGHKRRDVEQSVKGQLFDDIYCTYMLLGVAKPRSSGNRMTKAELAAAEMGTPPVTPPVSQPTITTPTVTIAQVTLALDTKNGAPTAAATRSIVPRLPNPMATPTSTPSPGPPAKPTRRTPARKTTNTPARPEPTTPQTKRGGAGADVKPTLLSAQRQMAQTQKMANTPTRFSYANAQTPQANLSSRRPTTLYEKGESATATPLLVPKSPAIGGRLMERIPGAGAAVAEKSSDKPFTRHNVARATFHFGQGRNGKRGANGVGGTGGGVGAGEEDGYHHTPPLSADDTKPASRVGFFSKLTARFGRRVIHLNEKDVADQRKNLTK
ncbi:uncharacterized protein Dana_GF18162 [Drosophila ananassae]|uniref:Serine/threonine-protein kinase par-1 n=1 Tax=Drosophila ananassae TaxID=7217 RepID=B3LXD2_DROAN|nr:serine/threonine-protein kinase MARK2 [Drosophila ananassae]EDV42776.1 uncharacterized protein Dana_GF18162 [Drosophila ananassae]